MGLPALFPPETTASSGSTVVPTLVVVTVERGKHHAIRCTHPVSGVARVPADRQLVHGRLAVHDERAVLGPEPGSIGQLLNVKPRLVQAVLGQLMQQFVAEPVEFAGLAVEPRLERNPRSSKVRRTVDAFMKQQRRTVFCILTNKNSCNKSGNDETDIHNNKKHNGLLCVPAKEGVGTLSDGATRPPVCLSVRLSVRPSSCLSHAPIIGQIVIDKIFHLMTATVCKLLMYLMKNTKL